MKILSAEFVKTAIRPIHYPEASLPEVAFVGRSNVGKSSLINALVQRRGLAKTSSTPGRTQAINFFTVNNAWSFVDLPGYGYAKAPVEVRRQWGPMIEAYLKTRKSLRLVVVLLDIRRDPSPEDRMLLEWLEAYNIPFAPVLTKSDKLTRNQALSRQRTIRQGLGLGETAAPLLFSAKTATGREDLWKRIVSTSDPSVVPPNDTV